jgi:isopenicillin-N epimerase
MERNPEHFFVRALEPELRAAADRLAQFLGAAPGSVAFVDNATAGVNTVLSAVRFQPGDEILLSRLGYPGIQNAAAARALEQGAKPVFADLPWPLTSEDEIVSAFAERLSPKTRLVIVEHVSALLAVVMPVAAIVATCRSRGVPVLVDGAHAPGMLPLNLAELDADWYVGNCHKWLWAPKGCGFLHAAPRAREHLHPLIISSKWPAGFPEEFGWTGTRDPSAWLSITAALEFHDWLGPDRVHAYYQELAVAAMLRLAECWEVGPLAPEHMFAAMSAVPVPLRAPPTALLSKQLGDALWREHRIEVPLFQDGRRLWLRLSGQLYNELDDYLALASTVPALLGSHWPLR